MDSLSDLNSGLEAVLQTRYVGRPTLLYEEVGSTQDEARLIVPNEKLASDTIRNSTIRSRETFAEITVPVPLSADLSVAVDRLREEVAEERDASVYVSSLDGNATLTIRAAAPNEDAAQKLERDLRVRAHGRLRTLGIWE